MNKIKSIVVFGGNGWVGTSVVRALLRKGASVTVVSRTGAPKGKKQEWHDNVNWRTFNLENYKDKKSKTSLLELLTGEGEENGGGETTCGVVSCVGTFGDPPLDQESMYEQNGLTNAFLATTAKEAGVKNFSFISAHQYPVAKQTVFKGYYRGKLHAETTIQSCQFDSCTILRPGFISGTRDGIPLWLAGTPMSTLFRSSAMKAGR